MKNPWKPLNRHNKELSKHFVFLALLLFLLHGFAFAFFEAKPGATLAATESQPVEDSSVPNTGHDPVDAKKRVSIGVARANITPPIPVAMAGYSARSGVYDGVNDSLFATVTVFDDTVNKAVLITADLIGFTHEWWEKLTAKMERETGIPPVFVMLSPNHNHGGPDTRISISGGEVNKDLLDYNMGLMDTFVALTREAVNRLQPALIGSGTGICKMNINRRALNPEGDLRIGLNPYGPSDHEVGVVRMDDANGTPMSLFVNWPCHATVMGSQNKMITADWPGAARRYIEREFPEPVVASITAGASGDINPIYREKPDFRRGETESIGLILGREVIRVAQEIQTRPAGSINALQRVITLPGKQAGGSWLPRDAYEPGPDQDVRLSLLRVGNILFVGVSGELFTEIGMTIKQRSPFRFTHVITHCNGASGYLITDDAYPEGGYEVAATRIMSRAEKGIIDNLTEMFDEIIE